MSTANLNADLRLAIGKLDELAIRRLLAAGADINAESPGNVDMLTSAIDAGASHWLCKFLLDQGVLVNPPEVSGGSPIAAAAARGSPDICGELISRGADVNRPSRGGMTALHQAAWRADAIICAALLEAGANVHCQNPSGLTPLHFVPSGMNAARELATAKALVASGASPSFTPKRHKSSFRTPFQMAVGHADEPLVSYYVRECGEDPEQTTIAGRSMLELAGKDGVKRFLHMLATERSIAATLSSSSLNLDPDRSRKPKAGAL
jgi:ankyrin repeat protein